MGNDACGFLGLGFLGTIDLHAHKFAGHNFREHCRLQAAFGGLFYHLPKSGRVLELMTLE